MKKIILLPLLGITVLAGVYSYLDFSTSENHTSIEQRFYLAPLVYINFPKDEGDFDVSLTTSLEVFYRGSADDSIVKVIPSWTLTQNKNEYSNYVLARVMVVPSETVIPEGSGIIEVEKIGETAEYEIFSKRYYKNNGEISIQNFFAEKTLKGRPDLAVRVEVLYQPIQKFATEKEAVKFLDDIVLNLEYDPSFLAMASDGYGKIDSHHSISPTDLDENEIEVLGGYSDELMEAIYYSMISESNIDFTAKEILKTRETLDGFCDELHDDPTMKILLPSSFTCVSSGVNILFSLSIDEGVNFCTDSSGYKGLIREGDLEKSSGLCN